MEKQKKYIIKCLQCGEFFITQNPNNLEHLCIHLNENIENKLPLDKIEKYNDAEIIGMCRIVGIIKIN